MKVKVLRSMSPDWLMCGVQAVLKPIASEGGRNVIRKGWEQLYIEPAAAAGGWAAAYTRKREREEAEVEAEVQRRVTAAHTSCCSGAICNRSATSCAATSCTDTCCA